MAKSKKRKIVFTTKKWKKPNAYRIQHLRANAFLDPKEKKFPIRKTNNGPIYMAAVRTAKAYAVKYNYPEVAKKADKLRNIYKMAKRHTTTHRKKTKR